MNPRTKSSLLIFISFFMFLSAGKVEGSCIDVNPVHLLPKLQKNYVLSEVELLNLRMLIGIQENSRKLMGFENVLDYDYAGPNPKHEARGKKGGGGSKNP